MRIILNRKREQGLLILGVVVLVAALGLGGCAFHEVWKRLDKIDEKRKQQETNDPPPLVMDMTQAKQPGDTEVLAKGETEFGATKIDTNWYNPALEDETGF